MYRNRDGSEWSREVVKTEEVGSRSYHFFSYNPPIEDNQFAIFRAPMYTATPDSLFLKVKIGGDINDAIWNTIRESNDNSPRWHWFSNIPKRWVENTESGINLLEFLQGKRGFA